jgi:hypothetical protein
MEAGPAFVLLGRVACRTFRCPLVRCGVPTPGQDSSSRKTVWIKEERVMGWGCSECAWVFNPSGPPIGKTLGHNDAEFPRATLRRVCVPRLRPAPSGQRGDAFLVASKSQLVALIATTTLPGVGEKSKVLFFDFTCLGLINETVYLLPCFHPRALASPLGQ